MPITKYAQRRFTRDFSGTLKRRASDYNTDLLIPDIGTGSPHYGTTTWYDFDVAAAPIPIRGNAQLAVPLTFIQELTVGGTFSGNFGVAGARGPGRKAIEFIAPSSGTSYLTALSGGRVVPTGASQATIFMVFKCTGAGRQTICGSVGGGFSDRHTFAIDVNGKFETRFYRATGPEFRILTSDTTFPLNDGEWHSLAVHMDTTAGGPNNAVWIDGVSQSISQSFHNAGVGFPSWRNHYSFEFGRYPGDASQHFTGLIDEFAAWGTFIEEADLLELRRTYVTG